MPFSSRKEIEVEHSGVSLWLQYSVGRGIRTESQGQPEFYNMTLSKTHTHTHTMEMRLVISKVKISADSLAFREVKVKYYYLIYSVYIYTTGGHLQIPN